MLNPFNLIYIISFLMWIATYHINYSLYHTIFLIYYIYYLGGDKRIINRPKYLCEDHLGETYAWHMKRRGGKRRNVIMRMLKWVSSLGGGGDWWFCNNCQCVLYIFACGRVRLRREGQVAVDLVIWMVGEMGRGRRRQPQKTPNLNSSTDLVSTSTPFFVFALFPIHSHEVRVRLSSYPKELLLLRRVRSPLSRVKSHSDIWSSRPGASHTRYKIIHAHRWNPLLLLLLLLLRSLVENLERRVNSFLPVRFHRLSGYRW